MSDLSKATIADLERHASEHGYEIEIDARDTVWIVRLKHKFEKRSFAGKAEQSTYGGMTNLRLYKGALHQATQMMLDYVERSARPTTNG